MNDVLNAIASRYSCRTYTGQMPSDDQLRAIADAANTAPSSMNRQPWRIIVLKNKELITELETEAVRVMGTVEDEPVKKMYTMAMAHGGKIFYNAPCMIMLPVDASVPAARLDCGIVCQTITLAATSLGLGSLICGLARYAFAADKAERFRQKLGFPEGFEFGMCVLLGEPQSNGTPHTPDGSKISFIE